MFRCSVYPICLGKQRVGCVGRAHSIPALQPKKPAQLGRFLMSSTPSRIRTGDLHLERAGSFSFRLVPHLVAVGTPIQSRNRLDGGPKWCPWVTGCRHFKGGYTELKDPGGNDRGNDRVLTKGYSATIIRELHRFKGAHSLQPWGESLVGALTRGVKERNTHLPPRCRRSAHRARPNSRIGVALVVLPFLWRDRVTLHPGHCRFHRTGSVPAGRGRYEGEGCARSRMARH